MVEGPPTGVVEDSGKGRCGRSTQGELGFGNNGVGQKQKNEGDLSLKQGNVATFGATSRRSRCVQNQRRDVPKEGKIDVATLQRRDVATLQRRDVATLQRRDVESQRCDVTEKAKNAI